MKFKEIPFSEVLSKIEDGEEIYNREIHDDQEEFKPIRHIVSSNMIRLNTIIDYEWFIEEEEQ